jgi:hypothetical protein
LLAFAAFNKISNTKKFQTVDLDYFYLQACYVTSNYEETKKKCDSDSDSYARVVDCTEFELPEGAYQ